MKKINKQMLMAGALAIFSLSLFSGAASATTTGEVNSSPASVVSSITLTAVNISTGAVEWAPSSVSAQGFKVVWSKNENPTYPCREGDEYHYYSNSDARKDTVTAFNGSGAYYVRVCEYLGGKCGTYSNQVKVELGMAPEAISESAPTANTATQVKSISLSKLTGNGVQWVIDGFSVQGFKVVWSKNQNPTYPNRDGDMYHYFSDPTSKSDVLQAFNGAGIYYVRVCEYLGGICGIYSNQVEVNLNTDPIINSEGETITDTVVSAIVLTGEANTVKWTADGYSANGFKVVWSMNENPVYPIREGDQYHYLSSPSANNDFIVPFKGNGTYFVRVCEYRSGGACGTYSNQISVALANAADPGVQKLAEIRNNAGDLYNNNLDSLLAQIDELKNTVKEQQTKIDYLLQLQSGLSQPISAATENAVNNFITYGVDANSKNLGEGERAAVMYSFKAAFNKLPETQSELEDAIKIANGRWPSLISDAAEKQAKAQFEKIYLRAADMNNAHDAAAIKVMAYGLRQQAKNRSLKSESAALKTYKAIYHKMPATTEEWNALQAITYSGATR
jgi:hypothetical protein